jgi:DNA-binding XRE family transcriptional regulator
LDGWSIECPCGGWLKPVSYGANKYTCAYCGHIWQSNSNKERVCPVCKSLNIVCHYEDVNKELYEDIVSNFNNYKQFDYVCPECKTAMKLYSKGIHNVTCPNGCNSLLSYTSVVPVVELLKAFRKKKGWTQDQMADRYGLSQGYYAKIESGHKPVPLNLQKLVKNYSL